MKIRYDTKVDAIYIELAKGKYEVSREVTESIIVRIVRSFIISVINTV